MSKGTLYTSYFAKIKQGKGLKISVARFNPKWLKDGDIHYWLKDLAPSKELLNDYRNGKIKWKEYRDRYLKERNCKSDIQFFKLLEILRSGKDITIYCYEKSGDNCHRHIIGDLFKELGYEVKEI